MALLETPGPSVDPGIVTMLIDSLQALQEQWEHVDASRADALLDASQDALTPLSRACTTINLHGLHLLLTGLTRNLAWFQQHPECFHDDQCLHFAGCLQAVHQHLEALADKGIREDLIDMISDDLLPIRADSQQGAFISGLLALASIQSPDDIECETATPDDIDLTVSDEIDPQLMEMLYDELPILVEEFQQHLQAVVVDHEADALLSAQRSAHTIKGLANMAGIKGLANLTHHLEDILEVLTDAKTFPGSKLTHDLTGASDCLAQMSESITEAGGAPDNAQYRLQQMMTWFYRLRTEGVECAAETLTENERTAPPPTAVPAVENKPAVNRSTTGTGQEGDKEHAHLRVSVGILDNLFRIAGESSTLNAQLDDTLTQLRSLSRSNRERQRSLQKVLFELEQQLQDHFTLTNPLQEGDSGFDPLEMDRYNSMHTTLSQLQEAVADVREVDYEAEHQMRQLAELHVRQSNLQKESLENVLHTRQVAVKTLSSRMQRIMRQASSAAGKSARLVIEGEDVMMDSQILNQLADPLMHIIRNAVDHGLETPHLRFEAGKDETGVLTIRFAQHNGKVHVSCEDDGAGINLKRVREIAERKGLINSDAELNERDIQRLILVPGFSTRDEISQLSGRGIGMDVVYQQVARMQGSLNIDSTPGHGTRFELSMPASSLLVHTLLVRSSSQRIFALSSHTIEQSLLSLDGELHQTENGLTFTTSEGEYPAYMLESLIGDPVKEYHHRNRIHPVLIVTLDHDRKAAVLVQDVIAHRELVFKSLSEHLPDIAGVPGVTILSNGDVAPIIDLQTRILDRASLLASAYEVLEPTLERRLPHLLVVDDSLSARKTLATLLRDSGYQVSTAIDGLDALDKVRADPPELILTDLEMPRMTGMELAAIISNSPQFSDIPVLMITSRSTHKHRGEAKAAGVSAYLTKPWTESAVLETVQSLMFKEITLADEPEDIPDELELDLGPLLL
ncbi:response regulator [Marinobacterium sp. 3-1745]|uniref:Chemotaxis protein CheA n=2 Tax=Marinobacterium marinum TaxID=2756129 RepID=A0A7W1WVX1_9GAMM|nr:response regulator [Marinobacterium marinum]